MYSLGLVYSYCNVWAYPQDAKILPESSMSSLRNVSKGGDNIRNDELDVGQLKVGLGDLNENFVTNKLNEAVDLSNIFRTASSQKL